MFFLLFLLPLIMIMIVAVIVVMSGIVIVAVVMIVLMAAIMIVTVILRMADAVIVVVTAIMIVAVIVVMIVIAAAIMVVIVLLEDGFQVLGKSLFGCAIDFSNGNSAFRGNLRARFKFGCEQRTFAVTPAELAVQLADRCLDDARLPSPLRALHQRAADAERRGLGEDDFFHLVDVRRSAEDAQQHTGAILFHLDRRREDFRRARPRTVFVSYSR